MNKIFRICLVLALLITVVCVTAPSAQAKGGSCGDGLTWDLTEDGVLTISGTGAMTDYALKIVDTTSTPWYQSTGNIKKVVIAEGVTHIGDYAFYNCPNLTEVTIPSSVTTIGLGAFGKCAGMSIVHIADVGAWCAIRCESETSNPLRNQNAKMYLNGAELEDLVIPDGITHIYGHTFYNCLSLKSVTIPDSVTIIDSYAFYMCQNLVTLTLGNGVQRIHNNAFTYCSNIVSVTLPQSLVAMGDNAFACCTNLYRVINLSNQDLYFHFGVAENALVVIDKNGNALYRDNTWAKTPDGFLYTCVNGVYTLRAYLGTENAITFPETINGNAYNIYNFRSYVPVNVTLPTGITEINDNAFQSCSLLTGITIPNSVTRIGKGAFQECCGLTEIAIPNSVTTIGNNAFMRCTNLTSLVLPDSVTDIGGHAFRFCSGLTSVTLPSRITTIAELAFDSCSGLISVTLPNNITGIGYGAFSNCTSLTDISIPGSVTTIGERAFMNCSNLLSVTFPTGVTGIEKWAFMGCESLTQLRFEGDAPSIHTSGLCVCATAYYPGDNKTWTSQKLQNYGGPITWVPYFNCDNGHTYEPVVLAPSCTEGGYTTYTCTVCGESYVDDATEALGHHFGQWYKTEQADTLRRDCENCNHFETKQAEPDGIVWIIVVVVVVAAAAAVFIVLQKRKKAENSSFCNSNQ